ncbi:MAG TPA: cache domain-containing protein [Alphaproteobacteria bacterium]|nr:cache domain-containing protein [Alphaproteobacteria bacterium]
MTTTSRTLLATAAVLLMTGPAFAEDHATKDEATAMVSKAVALIKSAGPDKAYSAIDDKANADFHVKDLYIMVYSLDGKCLAHGANPKLIGKDMSDAQDSDGVYYVKDRMKLAQSQPSFWQDYKFTNPVSKKIEPKTTFCQRLENTAVCGGIYK